MSDKLSIKNEMAQFDRKNRDFYDELTDEEKKKFSTFLMIRFGASVSGNTDLQAYYLMATNERLNKNFFDLSRHTKLQWLCATTVSPDMGNQFHYWLAAKKKTTDNKLTKFLTRLYPNAKDDEIALLAQLTDKKDLKAMAKEMGMDDKDIKKELD